jgi:cytochrome c peroxidase
MPLGDMKKNQLLVTALLWAAAFTCLSISLGAQAVRADMPQYIKPEVPPSPAFNPPTAEKIILGEKLFFDSRLSGANSISCASCHRPEYTWTDRRRFSLGETGKPRPRRTLPLQDVGWNSLFAWDGRIETLEGFVLGPISHPDEMNQSLELLALELARTDNYVNLYKAAFGTDVISIDGVAQSLAAYIRTLRSGISPFDRWIGGESKAISEAAQKGFALFTGKAGCSQCHTGWRFTDQNFYDIGLNTNDKGRGKLKADDVFSQYAFRTPSLRNIAIRPPYMHDGSLKSLEEVIEFYHTGIHNRPSLSPHIQPLNLNSHERLNVIEFLQSLTDDTRQTYIYSEVPTGRKK